MPAGTTAPSRRSHSVMNENARTNWTSLTKPAAHHVGNTNIQTLAGFSVGRLGNNMSVVPGLASVLHNGTSPDNNRLCIST